MSNGDDVEEQLQVNCHTTAICSSSTPTVVEASYVETQQMILGSGSCSGMPGQKSRDCNTTFHKDDWGDCYPPPHCPVGWALVDTFTMPQGYSFSDGDDETQQRQVNCITNAVCSSSSNTTSSRNGNSQIVSRVGGTSNGGLLETQQMRQGTGENHCNGYCSTHKDPPSYWSNCFPPPHCPVGWKLVDNYTTAPGFTDTWGPRLEQQTWQNCITTALCSPPTN